MAGMRSVLNLNVDLGMFGFGVKLYKAMDDAGSGIGFRQVHASCGTPIHQVKRCAKCECDATTDQLLKGYEFQPGKFVTFTDDEVKSVKPENDGVLKVLGYLSTDAIDPAFFDGGVWFLAPADKDMTTFATFRDALNGRWAVGRVVMYGREHVVAVRATDRVLSLHYIRTHAEFRSVENIPSVGKIPETAAPEYIAMMSQLMDAKRVDFDEVVLEHNAADVALQKMVDARVAGEALPIATVAEPPKTSAVDLMAMLKASLAAAAK